MQVSLAHLSDVHLGPMSPAWAFHHFKLKRLFGASNWMRKRRLLHNPEIAAAAMRSIRKAQPDHIAFTGDLLNISAWEEFPRGRKWLEDLGPPSDVSFVPGNHDAYVSVPYDKGLAHFAPWMMADGTRDDPPQFPFVRLRRNVALIGLNTGVPQALHKAGGTLGAEQLRNLPHVLESLQAQGFFRIILIHHPPLPGLNTPRKALTDAAELKEILGRHGCELVLHGHNHRSMLNWFETPTGLAPSVGVRSASFAPHGEYEPAGWNLFRIRRQHGRWQLEVESHNWDPERQDFVPLPAALLSPP